VGGGGALHRRRRAVAHRLGRGQRLRLSLSNCDLDGDGMRGGRKEVSVAEDRSECSG
jgi:hypothetical protein